MERVLAADIEKFDGKHIELAGWIHRIRELGAISFVLLRDRSGIVQLVFEGKVSETVETVISAAGTVRKNEKAPGGYEVHASSYAVMAPAAPDLPIPINQDPESINLDSLLDYRMLSIRIPKIRAAFTLQSAIIDYFGQFLRSRDFTEIKTSKLIGTGTEGGTNLFPVEYFETKVYLAQSPQFYKQAMISSGMERVFEIGAAYRAEKHETARHLNEYISLDVETAFIESERDLIELEKDILKYMFAQIREKNSGILDLWKTTVPGPDAVDGTPVIGYEEAKDIVKKETGKRAFDLTPEGERVLCDWALREHGIDAVFVNEFPRKARPFYTFPDGQKTMSFDLLFRGLEITSGSRRINEYAMLLENISRFGLTEEGLGEYVQIFRYGCPPHGGFAIGLERLTQKILGMKNVKEASLFPRDRKRVRP